jgi:hypothetical protein
MSFVCGGCKQSTKDGVKPARIVTQKRDKTYPNGGHGWEIAEEKLFCPPCGEKQLKNSPR